MSQGRAIHYLTAMPLLLLCCAALQAGDDAVYAPGLIGEYYHIGEELLELPALPPERKPNVKKVDKTLRIEAAEEGFNGTSLTDQFVVRWTGFLKAPKDGTYKLFLSTDDGSRLMLNGKVLIDNDGLHGPEERSAEVQLKAGQYAELRIDYFENTGSAVVIFQWQPPGAEKTDVPPSALFHSAAADK